MTTDSTASALHRSISRLGVIGMVWGTIVSVVCAASVGWLLVATSAEPETELHRSALSLALATVPGLVGTTASIIGMQIGHRRATAGKPRARLAPMLALALLAVISFGLIALVAAMLAVAAITLAA